MYAKNAFVKFFFANFSDPFFSSGNVRTGIRSIILFRIMVLFRYVRQILALTLDFYRGQIFLMQFHRFVSVFNI